MLLFNFLCRILGGITDSPRPNIYCKQNISDFSSCGDQKEIAIDENYCLSVDYFGRPKDIYSDPDYRMKCIAFWKENLKSYLITYDELDPFSKYRCWVYQRADLNRILMSQGEFEILGLFAIFENFLYKHFWAKLSCSFHLVFIKIFKSNYVRINKLWVKMDTVLEFTIFSQFKNCYKPQQLFI